MLSDPAAALATKCHLLLINYAECRVGEVVEEVGDSRVHRQHQLALEAEPHSFTSQSVFNKPTLRVCSTRAFRWRHLDTINTKMSVLFGNSSSDKLSSTPQRASQAGACVL